MIGTRIKVVVIDTLIMCMDCKVGMWRTKRPHFDGVIETGRCECICLWGNVPWVERGGGVTQMRQVMM